MDSPWIAVVVVSAGVLAVGFAVFVSWIGTRWIRGGWVRVAARVVMTPASLVAVALPLHWGVLRPLEEGHWRCVVCGALEDRLVYGDWVLYREPTKQIYVGMDSRPFERWFAANVARAHDHQWTPIGCHSARGWELVECHIGTGDEFYRALPNLPDPSIAKAMAERVLDATHEERVRWIRLFSRETEPDSPFRSIADGEPMTPEEFRSAYEAWLELHPEWN